MSTTALILLALFGIKHFIADFCLQNEKMVQEKGIYGKLGGIQHSSIHAILTFIVLYGITLEPTVSLILAYIDGILHYHIDWTKQQLTRRLTYTDRLWWFYMGLDQTLHHLTYIGIIWYATSS